MRKLTLALFAIVVFSMFLVACAAGESEVITVTKEVVVEKEVIKEVKVPGETIIVEKEIVKEVEVKVPGETVIVEKEVVKEVKVKGETVIVEKVVVKEVKVKGETVIVEKEVVKEVEVEKVVVVEVITEVPVALARPFQFSEAPMLAKLVKAGTLPPVEQRLPVNPLVQPVHEEIGQYGGTWRRTFRGTADGANMMRMWHAGLINFSEDGSHVVPYVAESWTVSDDLRVYTFRLRTNHKWSDGEPFNADDIMFWYNDIALNKDLNPNVASWLAPNGNVGLVTKIDDVTVRFSFEEPYGVFLEWFAQRDHVVSGIVQPAHYLKQFHASYADKATLDKLVADSAFETWTAMFNDIIRKERNADIPSLDNWISRTTTRDQQYIMERNPYYFAVDTAGNQLPYIDRIVMDLIEDTEVMNLKAMAGEVDMQCRFMKFSNYPLFKQNEDKGDYRTALAFRDGALTATIVFNQSYDFDAKDPVSEWLRNKTFRQALSIAIDRDRINELAYLGLGTMSQQTVPKDHPYYPGDEYALRYIEYNPNLANQMLDEILPKKDTDGNRLLPNGETLILQAEWWSAGVDLWGPLVQEDWTAVGIKSNLKEQQRGLFYDRIRSNEFQIEFSGQGGWMFLFTYPYWTAPWHNVSRMGPGFAEWYQSRGAKGTAPTGNLLRTLEILDEAQGATPAERAELARENFRILNEELYTIGVIAKTPGPCVVKNNMGNVPQVLINEWTQRSPGNHRTETFFFKQ
jgi:peptide/nickel transport system substrate-binding protein